MNKQFKVGDQVVRINQDSDAIASVGQKATVIAVDAEGDLRVNYEGWSWPVFGELWRKANTELVQAQESVCKFVPGNTYKDEEGREYKFLLHVPEAKSLYERAVFINKYGDIVLRHEEGYHPSPRSRLDILPNKEIRTVDVYSDGRDYYAYDSEDSRAYIRHSEHWTKIGEVKEEVEVY